MAAPYARRVRATILCAPAHGGNAPGFRIPSPSLDMLDARELRVPRRTSDNRRRGDAPCPRLYGDDLDLSTFAQLRPETIGSVSAEPSFHLSPHALVDAASGQLTACLAARALAGRSADRPLQSLWFASGEVAVDDAEIDDAEVVPVGLIGFKAQLAATLLRRLALDHPGVVLVSDGVPTAPFVVSSHQDLVEARSEVELLRAREGPDFWPFEVEATPEGWSFTAPDGRTEARLVFVLASTVGEAEAKLAAWHASRLPPAWVEHLDRSSRWGRGVAATLTAGLAVAAIGALGTFMLPSPHPIPASAPAIPAERPRQTFELTLEVPTEGDVAAVTTPAAVAESPTVPTTDRGAARNEDPRAPRRDPVAPPRKREPRTNPQSNLRTKAPSLPRDHPLDAPETGEPSEIGASKGSPPSPAEPEVALRLRLSSRGGLDVAPSLDTRIRRTLRACFDRGACPEPSGILEVTVIDNLANRANPFLEIEGRRCTSARIESCFR